MKLEGKKILLGITGSIAAFKAVNLLRLLVKEGAEVKVILSPFSEKFVTRGTLAALSGNPVLSEFFKEDGTWNSHVELGLWADLYLLAPVTANSMAKMATGQADNLLIATYLSAKCQVAFAPAMDLDMYIHPSTQKNISILQSYGNILIEPAIGELASKLFGKGRLREPEEIFDEVIRIFAGSGEKKKLNKLKILITAGPTQEAIDPVRFIGNHSSGKMAYEIAEECAGRGAEVILVSGPVQIKAAHPNIRVINVISAEEMYIASVNIFKEINIAILAAAVADFSPEITYKEKLKRGNDALVLNLKPTKDIAQSLGQMKSEKQLLIGFALETNNEVENARLKLKKKNLDMIVLNSLNDTGAGFQSDTNKVTIIDKNNNIDKFELKSKKEVATDVVEKITGLWNGL